MGRFFVEAVLVVLALAGMGTALFGGDSVRGAERKLAGVLGVLCFIAVGMIASYQAVPAGHRGVLLRFGAVNGVLDEGLHFITPFVNKVTLVEVRTLKSQAKAAAASKDMQTVQSEVAVNHHISPQAVGDLYKQVGLNYEERIIQPAVQETLKAIVAKYTARELIQRRDQVKNQVDSELSKRLRAYNIIVEPNGVSLTNFDFSAEFNQAIESKQVAQQESEKSKYLLDKAKTDAQTAIMVAKGEAEANRVKARALNGAGGQKVLAREWITKWDGKLPTVSGGSDSNIIDLRSLMTTEAKEAQ